MLMNSRRGRKASFQKSRRDGENWRGGSAFGTTVGSGAEVVAAGCAEVFGCFSAGEKDAGDGDDWEDEKENGRGPPGDSDDAHEDDSPAGLGAGRGTETEAVEPA